MRYYLVALFDTESFKEMSDVQKGICKKYKLNKNMPALHITLETISDPDLNKLDEILNKVIHSYKRFKVEVNDSLFFDESFKSVNIKIESKGYISRLSRILNDKLKTNKFNVKDSTSRQNLTVALANSHSILKDWSSDEKTSAYIRSKSNNPYKLVTIDRIELWKPTNNKKEIVVKSYPLKHF